MLHFLQTKKASHFAAWSACLLEQEIWRKAQLSGTEGGLDTLDTSGGRRGGGGEGGGGVEVWMEKAQETINSLRNGEQESLARGRGGDTDHLPHLL